MKERWHKRNPGTAQASSGLNSERLSRPQRRPCPTSRAKGRWACRDTWGRVEGATHSCRENRNLPPPQGRRNRCRRQRPGVGGEAAECRTLTTWDAVGTWSAGAPEQDSSVDTCAGCPEKAACCAETPPAPAVNPSSTQTPSGREDSGGRTLREGSEGGFGFRLTDKGLISLICQENDQRYNRKWANTVSVHKKSKHESS